MTKEQLRNECQAAAEGRSFAATAVKLTAERMGILSTEALAAYNEALRLSDEAFKLPPNTPERIALHEGAAWHCRLMAADVARRLAGETT